VRPCVGLLGAAPHVAEGAETETFRGRLVAVPETRQLDVLANLLARRGADVLRCPLVAIKDSPDTAGVVAWLERALQTPPDLFVFYTGEGIERLLGFAERAGLEKRFVELLARTRKLTRGPKPKRALKRLALDADLEAAAPTTAGLVATLETLDLGGKRVAVQLYADAHVPALERALAERGASVDWVMPYVYASESDDTRVVELIEALHAGRVDAIAFTSQSQATRLFEVADARSLRQHLMDGLARTLVAAVGPVVAAMLAEAGVRVDTVPHDQYFMKPLVTALEAALSEPPRPSS
jgi:uroporphyrinogen-III synthase